MVHGVAVLGDLVLRGLVAPVSDEVIVRRRIGGINANRDGDFHSHNDSEGGLDWIHLAKYNFDQNSLCG